MALLHIFYPLARLGWGALATLCYTKVDPEGGHYYLERTGFCNVIPGMRTASSYCGVWACSVSSEVSDGDCRAKLLGGIH